jgi:transposase
LSKIDRKSLVYLDETGFDTFYYREYARAPRDERAYGEISGRKFQRTSVVAAKCENRIIAPVQYDGTMDAQLFEWWFETQLLPAIPRGSTIVLDNARVHRKSELFDLAADSGCFILFLPAYSPDLNPIEHFWAWIKQRLRSILSQFISFDEALTACF